jgi:hypothetical protein
MLHQPPQMLLPTAALASKPNNARTAVEDARFSVQPPSYMQSGHNGMEAR